MGAAPSRGFWQALDRFFFLEAMKGRIFTLEKMERVELKTGHLDLEKLDRA